MVDGRDPAAVAAAITGILRAPAAERDRMGAAGRQWVRAQWSWDTTADRLAALLTPPQARPDPLDAVDPLDHLDARPADAP